MKRFGQTRWVIAGSILAIAGLLVTIGLAGANSSGPAATVKTPLDSAAAPSSQTPELVSVTDDSAKPGSTSIQEDVPNAATFSVVAPDLADAVRDPAAPDAGIPAVFLADSDALSDPTFQRVAGGLERLAEGLYQGNLTIAGLAAVQDVQGLRVSRNRPVTVDPPTVGPQVDPKQSPVNYAIDADVTVSQVDPKLAAARTSLGLQGTGQVIAVIDTGVDTNAIGLGGKVIHREDFAPPTLGCSDNGFLDPYGHGTHVSSIAAGAVNAVDPGIVGVAPEAKIVDVRVFNCDGTGTNDGTITQALNWVKANRVAYNISVVNLSLGDNAGLQDGTDAVSILVNQLVADGVFVAVAAGNAGDAPSTIYSPGTAFYATTIGSAAVNQYGSYLSYFSSRGPVPAGAGVDFLAAGSSIRAAKSTALSFPGSTGVNTVVWSGTSMATPYVAGLAALLHQKNPSHAPSGSKCVTGPSCPLGVVESSMHNGIENDISAGDWFDAGVDAISGHGLVSASNSLAGVPTPPSAALQGNLNASSPTMIEVPPHSQPVTLTVVTDPSFPAKKDGNEILDFAWLDASGATSAPSNPCDVQIEGSWYSCGTPAVNGFTIFTRYSWSFYSPPNSGTSWLRLTSNQAGTFRVNAGGLDSPLVISTGLRAADVTLNGTGNATVVVERTVSSSSPTTLGIVATGSVSAPASVVLPAGAAGTTVSIPVAESAGFAPVAPQTAARLALSSGSSLLLDVSVRFAAPEAAAPGQITVAGDQILSGDLVANSIRVTSNGTVFGDSNQGALVRAPFALHYYTGPFLVQPGSNDAQPIAITQTTVSGIDALGISGDGSRALLYEDSYGAGVVSGDTDNRGVTFVRDLTTSANREIGSLTVNPMLSGLLRPVLSEDGASAGFVASGVSSTKDIYWQGGSNFGTMTKLASLPASYDIVLTGVNANGVLAEVLLSGSTVWRARFYPAIGGAFTPISDVASGSSTLNADGSAIAYVPSNLGSAGCYRTSNGTTVSFSVSGHLPEGSMTAGTNCSFVVGQVERISSFPNGWQGSQLVSTLPDGARTVLAESSRNDVDWVVNSSGGQALTVSGLAFAQGDTNGLVDVYRGALGVGSTVTGPMPTIGGIAAVGATLTANSGTWDPATASLDFQWNRAGIAIYGARSATYAPVAADVGKSLTVSVTGSRDGYFPRTMTSDSTVSVESSLANYLPSVASIAPGYGPRVGGTTVTITGTNLGSATRVTFGGVTGTGLSVASETSLTVVTPAGMAVRAPVVITNAVGDSIAGNAAFFAYSDVSVVAGVPAGIADVSNFTPGVVQCFQVTGKAGVPVGATGVILNVTASLPNAVGHVRVYPDYSNNGASVAPAVSTVNFEVNSDVANSTTISLPTDGKVCAYGVGGTLSRLILDVDGYILPGSGINLVTPEKLIDTRSQVSYHVGPIIGPVEPMTDYTVQVAGVGSVPVGATAVMVNITVVDTNTPGHLRMWASDQAMPNTSVVNYAPETKANSQIVALGADGKIKFRSFSYVPTSVSPVQILIDVTGYITAGSDFTATVPTKLVETRPSYGIVGPIPGALTSQVVYPVAVDTSVVPAGATAVVLNVTAVQPTNFGHIRVYPDTNGLGTTTPPIMSNLNFIPGRDIPNMVIVQLPADRKIDFYTVLGGNGRTDLVVNIIGYIIRPAI